MSEEGKDDGRRGWLGKKSRSSLGGSTAHEKEKQDLEPKDLLKTKSGKEKRWFRKKFQVKEGSNGHGPVNSELTDLEPADEKPVQRTVQGFYRDDDGGPSPAILQTTVSAARDAVKEFAKDFVSQLTTKPDLCVALEAQMRRQLNSAPAAPTADLKFLAQAYTVLHLFSGFENASFGISNPGERPWEVEQHMATCFEQFQTFKNKTETISKLLENKPCDSFLSEFCTRKFKSLVPVDVESAMFGADCEHHSELLDQKHPETAFYRSFLSAAVSVWLLQRLRFSFEQKVVTISPTVGDKFHRRFMLPAVPGIGDNDDEESDHGLEVLYTVFPGFRVGESIVKSLVYIVDNPISPPIEVETATEQTSSSVVIVATEEHTSSNIENVATEHQTASNVEEVATDAVNVDNAATVKEIASTVNNNAAVEEAPEIAGKSPSYVKSDSLPVTPSTRKEEISEIKVPKKSFSTKEPSHTEGSKRGLFQKIRRKIFRKKTSKKDKAADSSSSPAVSPSVEGKPTAQQPTPTATTSSEADAHHHTPTAILPSVEGEPAAHQSTPTSTKSVEGEQATQDTPAAAAAITSVEGEPATQDTPAAAAATTSVEGEPATQDTPAAAAATTSVEGEPATQDTPAAAAATTSVEGEPATQATPAASAAATKSVEGEPATQDTPAAAAATKSVEGELATQDTPAAAAATTSVDDEPAAHQSTPAATASAESVPAAQDAAAATTSVQSEISPLEEVHSSEPVPSAAPSKDGEIEVSGSPSPKGPPLNTLD